MSAFDSPQPADLNRQALQRLAAIVQQVLDHPDNTSADGDCSLNVEIGHVSALELLREALPPELADAVRRELLVRCLGDPFAAGVSFVDVESDFTTRKSMVESRLQLLATSVLTLISTAKAVSRGREVFVTVRENDQYQEVLDALYLAWAELKAIVTVGAPEGRGGVVGFALMTRPELHGTVNQALSDGLETLTTVQYRERWNAHIDDEDVVAVTTEDVLLQLRTAVEAAREHFDAMSRVR